MMARHQLTALLLILVMLPLALPAGATTNACANFASGFSTPKPWTINAPAGGTGPSCSGSQLSAANSDMTCLPALPIVIVLPDVVCGPLVAPGTILSCSSDNSGYNNLIVAWDLNSNGNIDSADQVFYNSLNSIVLGEAVIQTTPAPGPVRWIMTVAAGSGPVNLGCI